MSCIKTYGEYWNPFSVDWKKKELFGEIKIKRKSHTINFWKASGIYILILDFKPIYIGQANKTLGERLKAHIDDRFSARWDMFSWYSVCKENITYKNINQPTNRQIIIPTLIDTLEALSILITDPPLNRKRESIPDAKEFEQVVKSPVQTMREQLADISINIQKLKTKWDIT